MPGNSSGQESGTFSSLVKFDMSYDCWLVMVIIISMMVIRMKSLSHQVLMRI